MSADPRIGWPTFYAAKLSPRRAPVGTVAKPLPLIIDCDPGHDDAMAIAIAVARPELKLLGVTTVAGNATLPRTFENARRVLALLGAGDTPVAAGAAVPLVRPLFTAAYTGVAHVNPSPSLGLNQMLFGG